MSAKLSIPHIVVLFVVVLVVFGPQKLPELARSLGKLMAEFRKASTDFKTAFDEEMRDIERQARDIERKKAAEAAAKALPAPGAAGSAEDAPADTSAAASSNDPAEAASSELVIATVPESVPRGSAIDSEPVAETPEKSSEVAQTTAPAVAPHDHQQLA